MSIPNHIVERFFQGGCTDDEKQQVIAYFRENPEKLAQYLTEDSWEDFTADARQEVPTAKMRHVIEDTIGRPAATPPVAPVRRIHFGWVAAASLAALTVLGFLLYKKAPGRVTPDIAAVAPLQIKKQAPQSKDIRNTSSKTLICFLPDGSKVGLSRSSTITFDSAFTNGRRDIFLEGQAVFTVKKDNARPFTVHSKGIATTALGTVFSVSDKKGGYTMVHLFSGRVVVKKEKQDRSFKDIYLMPGQQLTINKEDFTIQIKDTRPAAGVEKPVTPSATQQALHFDSRPLTEIFSLLQKEYNVSISYDPATLQNMTFTGLLNRDKESLDSFLSTLCDLNDLSLKKISDNHYSIQVKQP
ncbi:MAG TPA: FecR domain-containing protein [Puia sp.]|nr:FecR domain-containing protein [Puia sp.]